MELDQLVEKSHPCIGSLDQEICILIPSEFVVDLYTQKLGLANYFNDGIFY